MAITPISNRYKGFIFAGENSRDYGVYITEPAVFGSPERDVEMVSVAGRNGDYIIDNGRYNNIEVVYNCALPAESDSDFIDGVSAFRNMLSSRIGYQRLTDEINSGEYREGAFVAGLDVDTLNVEAGTFSVRFNCKPQRFLTAGETAVELNSGEEITNPTAYDSRPLLKVWGYGGIDIGGQDLVISDTTIGNINLYPSTSKAFADWYGTIDESLFEIGDTLTVKEPLFQMVFNTGSLLINSVGTPTVTGVSLDDWDAEIIGRYYLAITYGWGDINFTVGTYMTLSTSVSVNATVNGGTYSILLQLSATYDPDDHSIEIEAHVKPTSGILSVASYSEAVTFTAITGYSTKTALGTPLYFDLDIGEAYVVENGVPVSVNNAVTIPAVLPTLPAGATEVTFDNTITKLEIVPRWWLL